MVSDATRHEPEPVGDILKGIARKTRQAKRALKGRRLAQQVLDQALGPQAQYACVASVKSNVITIETGSPAFFQEVEGFRREQLLGALRQAGLNVSVLRVRLAGK